MTAHRSGWFSHWQWFSSALDKSLRYGTGETALSKVYHEPNPPPPSHAEYLQICRGQTPAPQRIYEHSMSICSLEIASNSLKLPCKFLLLLLSHLRPPHLPGDSFGSCAHQLLASESLRAAGYLQVELDWFAFWGTQPWEACLILRQAKTNMA